MAAALEVVYQYIQEGKVLGPFPGTTRLCPITGHPLVFYPSFVVPKSKLGSFRWVLNASHNVGGPSINDRIYDYTTHLVGVKESLYPCLRTRFMSRIDLRRAFKQLFRSISQLHLLATVVDDNVFIEATMSMGLRNTCKLFEEDFMKAFVKGLTHHHPALFTDTLGALIDNYLDDIWFVGQSASKNRLQMLIAEWWAKWLGIELNDEKREAARSKTRHLGFLVNLKNKSLAVTDKHKRRVIAHFDNFLLVVREQKGIHIKSIQRLLGLQIWISTVFRVARQFLTSTCDIIRVTGEATHFYPRRHRALTKRAVFDISFWRRFVKGDPESSFSYFLNLLPVNDITLSCDASGAWGMSGVLRFAEPCTGGTGLGGLFWQISWHQWSKIKDFGDLRQGHVKICVAEFLAALITLETFADRCSGKFTTIEMDNTVAKQW